MDINTLEDDNQPIGFTITRGDPSISTLVEFGVHPKTPAKYKNYRKTVVFGIIGTFGGYPAVIAVNNNDTVYYYAKDLRKSSLTDMVYVLMHQEVFDKPVIVQSMNEVFVRTHNPNGRRTVASCRGGEFSMELLMPIWVSGRDA